MTMAGTTVAGTAVRLFWPGRTLGPCDSFYADDGGGGMVAVVFCDDDDDVVMVDYCISVMVVAKEMVRRSVTMSWSVVLSPRF
ncbi:proline-rich receptor-like protein kinase PERK2 [Iris pallida]|uniref:Proline-rich receptor-like protein kinase PERK2 n=1 Tax=Iris pallida TaxID=29817 RepID=A0AAX6ECC8_IRIPA|nr:proline-rich receptor-like protein kinase PERK2 [Iris pallida]